MLILGIDPGTATTGYALLEAEGDNLEIIDFGIIKTEAGTEHAIRLHQICEDIEELIKEYNPDQSAIEEIFFSKNVKTGIAVAQARGAIIATLTRHGVPVTDYKPVEIKSAVCGNGHAEKSQIQRMVQMILNLDSIPTPDDAADAIAIAITHANSYNLNKQIDLHSVPSES